MDEFNEMMTDGFLGDENLEEIMNEDEVMSEEGTLPLDTDPEEIYNPQGVDIKQNVGTCDCFAECEYNSGWSARYSNYGYSG